MNTTQKEIQENNKSFYNIWMEERNYLVQDVAHAFGEATCFKMLVDQHAKMSSKGFIKDNVKDAFGLMFELYFTTTILKHSNWFLFNKLVSAEAMKSLQEHQHVLIKQVHPINQ